MYEDERGIVQHKVCVIFNQHFHLLTTCRIKIHSKLKTWSAIPDNALQNKEYHVNLYTWTAQGFDGKLYFSLKC